LILGLLALFGGLSMATSWWYMAVQASRSWALQARVDSLEAERIGFLALADQMSQVEQEYERLRSLFGTPPDPVTSGLWLPPSGLPGGTRLTTDTASEEYLPTSWPLTETGRVTQALVAGGTGDHPGLDIAIGTGSYVRAAGAGRVVRTGEDPLYGLFLVLDHGDGYQTVYAHASMILVERGRDVRRNEVIALSGSTGRSTAPHLHFEVLLEGTPVDPLTMVEKPS
jgi:murein DD-endopeptidase MepM/ murein hydrolase activator NlpD